MLRRAVAAKHESWPRGKRVLASDACSREPFHAKGVGTMRVEQLGGTHILGSQQMRELGKRHFQFLRFR
jgi:hypothetical protein